MSDLTAPQPPSPQGPSFMQSLLKRPAMRWLVPFTAAAAVLAGGAAIGALTAAADPTLPPRNAAQLLVDLQTARLDGLSGTVVQTSDLGLPALPGGGAGSADLTALLSGTHTLRVWYSGPDKARVALLGTLGETDVITNGKDLWVWSSKENKASHRKLPATIGAKTASPMPSLPAFTPQQLADAAIKMLDKSTAVTTEGTITIAGRDAYELVLAPRDPASLIGSIRLAVDATEHLPLRVQVFARGASSPAFKVEFTQISFTRPADDQFTFNPPPGATVVEESTPGTATKPEHQTQPGGDKGQPKVATVGSGWTTVLVAALPTGNDKAGGDKAGDDKAGNEQQDLLQGFLKQLPAVSGTWGSGHLLTSSLLSVLVTDDGRILVGAVRPDKLYAAAADPAAKLTK